VTRRHVVFAGACLAVALVLVGATVMLTGRGADRTRSTGAADVGGAFELVDQNGRPQTQALLDGKWTAVFFGFTHCPDFCPMTLTTLAEAQDQLGPKAADLQIVFISVDPERDTPAQLKTYLESPAFPRGVIGLTGTPEQVSVAVRAYRAWAQKSGEGPDYVVDHTTAVYLMGPDGRFSRVVAYGLPPTEIARQIRDAMNARS
jgi:protein SCO1/2